MTTTTGAATTPLPHPEPLYRIGSIVRLRNARRLACHVTKRRYQDGWEYALTSIDTRRDIGWQREAELFAATQKRTVRHG